MASFAGNAAFQRLTEDAARKSPPQVASAGKRPKRMPAAAAGECSTDF